VSRQLALGLVALAGLAGAGCDRGIENHVRVESRYGPFDIASGPRPIQIDAGVPVVRNEVKVVGWDMYQRVEVGWPFRIAPGELYPGAVLAQLEQARTADEELAALVQMIRRVAHILVECRDREGQKVEPDVALRDVARVTDVELWANGVKTRHHMVDAGNVRVLLAADVRHETAAGVEKMQK
jgi:hypothetical protein